MTAGTLVRLPLDFVVDADHEAHEPPESRGGVRSDVRLMVSTDASTPVDARFTAFASFLDPGDVLVVNATATVPAAFSATLADGVAAALHYSGDLPGGLVLVEIRALRDRTTAPLALSGPQAVALDGGGVAHLLACFGESRRLWIASLELGGDFAAFAARHGRPIRYRHVPGEWPLSAYQTIFSAEPGSAEMPSASRPFTDEMVTDLVNRGVLVVPVTLHTGVSSLEGNERPYPERYRVAAATAEVVNDARRRQRRVVAAGTTVVRALAAVSDERGAVHPGSGWTEVLVTREHPVPAVTGLLTGWHEPDSSHLLMLESFAPAAVLQAAYDRAIELGYRWHEFGDTHLLLADARR